MKDIAQILIVDDEPGVRAALRMMLETADHVVLEAVDGDEAMRCVAEHRFDLGVMDIGMPRKEGIETIIDLRTAMKDLPIIAITGGSYANLDPE